jgi:UbiD family decarboxylase
MPSFLDLPTFVERLDREGELLHIHEEVDPTLEIAEIHRRVVSQKGKALFFHKVKNSLFPVVTNLFGSDKRVALAFGGEPASFIKTLVGLIQGPFPPPLSTLINKRRDLFRLFSLGLKNKKRASVTECVMDPPDLNRLPLLKLWPEDGGHFITLPLVYTEAVDGHSANLGMYRIQRYDSKTTGLHMQIAKGGGFHFHQAEELSKTLPVTIFVGGPPALIISAIAPLPENVPELIFASLLQGQKLEVTRVNGHPHPLIGNAEFALVGEARPFERRPEGPFGDHFGYYSLTHDFPVFHCKKIYHRKKPIYPATVVGKPLQEDLYIGNYLQELFAPLFPLVMPQVKALHTYGETGFHPLGAAIVKERYEKESLAAAFRILGEGQLSLTKFLVITDAPINLRNSKELFETVLSRFSPESGFFIFSKTSNDTLDYTGPKLNHGSKAVLLGVGKEKRKLPRDFSGTLPRPFKHAVAYCAGLLVVDGPSYEECPTLPAPTDHFTDWPLVIVVDDAQKTCTSELEFLWTVFTRFDPAGDIQAKAIEVKRNHLSYTLPLMIDARMKPSYPKEVVVDEATKELVDKKWSRYFNEK